MILLRHALFGHSLFGQGLQGEHDNFLKKKLKLSSYFFKILVWTDLPSYEGILSSLNTEEIILSSYREYHVNPYIECYISLNPSLI
ncbi:hypothetical protein [African swine fever virus]|uniref:Uncharacterized protein n=1 Tax=African swine fever virus TaxID=10497 RepID=A0A3G1EUS6_ASF|nr:hypothetical protein F8221_gp029 [African swine fever virus]AOO54334.1 hypothetical protein AFSV47Ss_0029 [African swine fever virus]QIM06670.1 hypothetical protein [African swine fever virus]QIM06905.1 hypothetical protein [African swine fever virus]QIM07140.1 hypothetical protein [African swine fever virus]QIM07375.1 hypothetical protein [African swine fever virus]